MVAPTGRDAVLARQVLEQAGFPTLACRSLAEMRRQAGADGSEAGALLVAEEALLQQSATPLRHFVETQPVWSSLPILVLRRGPRGSLDAIRDLQRRGNVTILERPLGRTELVSAVSVALRARLHQYELRAQMAERENHLRELHQMVAERDVLLGEVHHRVRNNLQMVLHLLDMENRRLPKDLRAVRGDSIGRIRAMTMVHELLYESQDFSHFEVGAYLRRLTDALRLLHPRPITVHWEMEPLTLGLGQAIPIGLIAHEVVTNAMKHGGDALSRLDIAARVGEARRVRLAITDDGPGLPEGVDPPTAGGMGGRLIAGLTQQLGGTCRFEPADGGGTAFVLDFPLPVDEKAT